MRQALAFVALAVSLVSSAAQADEQVSFMEYLRQVSSAVPPLRIQAERTVSAVFPGRFTGRRAEAVLITNDSASLCRGPDYRRCLALGYLPTRRTVATTVNGESLLLVLDTLSSIRACTVDAANERAALSCRAADANKLKDYNAESLADGKVLQITGTDGIYWCSSPGGTWPSCTHILNTDGTPTVKPGVAGKLERRQGFKPLDSDKTCRVKAGEIFCNSPQKLSELDDHPVAPFMRPVLYYYDEDDRLDPPWVGQIMDAVIITAERVDASAPADVGFWGGTGAHGGAGARAPVPPQPPTAYRDECLRICEEANIDYQQICVWTGMAVGIIFLPGSALIGPFYFAACEGGRALHYLHCRGFCGT